MINPYFKRVKRTRDELEDEPPTTESTKFFKSDVVVVDKVKLLRVLEATCYSKETTFKIVESYKDIENPIFLNHLWRERERRRLCSHVGIHKKRA